MHNWLGWEWWGKNLEWWQYVWCTLELEERELGQMVCDTKEKFLESNRRNKKADDKNVKTSRYTLGTLRKM